jgi:hypothetical protein
MKKQEKMENLDSDLDWTWTTICIYKKPGKKYDWTKIYLFFTIIVMLKI